MRVLARIPRLAWALLALALAVRLVVVAVTDLNLVADPSDYHRYGESLANTGSFPVTQALVPGATAYRPPAYPLFLGALYEVFGVGTEQARLAQAFLGTVTVALLGLVAFQLFGRRVALVALAIGAVWLPWVVVGATLLSEVLVVPLILAAIACVLHARSTRWVVAAGMLAGLAVLTRPNAALLLIPLALAVRRPRAVVALVAAAALTLVPWTVRNAVELDAFVPVSTQDGPTLAGTYNDTARGFPNEPWNWVEWFDDPRYARYAQIDHALPEAELASTLRAEALDYVAEHPAAPVEVGWWNSGRLLHATGFDFVRLDVLGIGLPYWLGVAAVVVFWAGALAALAGLRAARAAPRWLWLVPAMMLLTVFAVAYARFRAPADAFVILLAALGVSQVRDVVVAAKQPVLAEHDQL
jgi:4-amino-4-deoxy-L-arabinose transferase-like glycosyltransferase